ncbi:Electron transfer flavoprotein subunit alpha [Dirofilaria immitis]
MEMECFNEICKIEKCIKVIVNFVDTWKNLNAQLEATRKMPQYTSLMLHLSNWQPRLMARIELEIDIIASKLFEQWKQIEEAANMLNDFIAVDWKPREAALSPCHQDFQHLLTYLMVEIIKWLDVKNEVICPAFTAPMKLSVDVEKIIARCRQNLQAVKNQKYISRKS